jgi:hypothetical protein
VPREGIGMGAPGPSGRRSRPGGVLGRTEVHRVLLSSTTSRLRIYKPALGHRWTFSPLPPPLSIPIMSAPTSNGIHHSRSLKPGVWAPIPTFFQPGTEDLGKTFTGLS